MIEGIFLSTEAKKLISQVIWIFLITCHYTWMFPKIGGKTPKWMVKTMENPIKMDDLGGPPLFLETPTSIIFPLLETLPSMTSPIISSKKSHHSQWRFTTTIHFSIGFSNLGRCLLTNRYPPQINSNLLVVLLRKTCLFGQILHELGGWNLFNKCQRLTNEVEEKESDKGLVSWEPKATPPING